MKKILLILSILFLFTLTGCKDTPFVVEDEGFTFVETNELSYSYFNGLTTEVLFSYEFSETVKFFVNEDYTILNFTNINNYHTITKEIKDFIEAQGDNVSYRRTLLPEFDDKINLSLGADAKDYNYEKVEHDGEVYLVDTFISAVNGLSIIVSYTEFYVDGDLIMIPSFIQIYTNVIHSEISWEYLDVNNQYTDNRAKLISYETLLVPLPMKTGVNDPFADLIENDSVLLGLHQRLVDSNTTNVGVWELCSETNTESCIEESHDSLQVQIYEMSKLEVIEFYETYYEGVDDGTVFTFTNLGVTFILSDMDEVLVQDESGEIITVVNAVISIYE